MSASESDPCASAWLAALRKRRVVEGDYVAMLQVAAAAGDPFGMALLGEAHLQGVIRTDAAAEGLQLIRLAYEQGNADAANMLGELHAVGYPGLIVSDLRRSAELFAVARERGYVNCYANSAIVHQQLGEWQTAEGLLTRGAELGDQEARQLLVAALFTGESMPRDLKRAVALAERWSDDNGVIAGSLGRYYIENPDSHDVTGRRILELLNQAARTGDQSATLAMCDGFVYGLKEVQPMPHLAVSAYLQLIDKFDNSEAAFRLGRLYLAGLGVKRDTEKAKTLLRAASDAGHRQARGLLIAVAEGSSKKSNPAEHP